MNLKTLFSVKDQVTNGHKLHNSIYLKCLCDRQIHRQEVDYWFLGTGGRRKWGGSAKRYGVSFEVMKIF